MAPPTEENTQDDNRHEEMVEKRRSSDVTSGYIFKTVPRDRPTSHPPSKVNHNSPSMANKRRSLSASKGKGKNSLEITTGSGTNVTLRLSESTPLVPTGPAIIPRNRKDMEVERHDLYKEAMYTCMHMLGTQSPGFPASQQEMCIYVHSAFSESQKEQEAVLEHVKGEGFPLTIVNTRVKRAFNLVGSKQNGVVDPYCLVTIETDDSVGKLDWKKFASSSSRKKERLREKHLKPKPPPEKRSHQIYETLPKSVKTSVERHKKDPKWDQRFQLLALRPSVDSLTVEVWDHSIDDKYVAKAIRNFSDPGGTEDLNSKLKTFHPKSDRKKGDVFLGKVSIRVSEIPCEGLDQVLQLEGAPQTKNSQAHGKLRLQLWLVHAYRHGQHYSEVATPTIMLGNFWDWILQTEKAACPEPEKWDGSIPQAATCFLFQYALQNGIAEDTHALIRWESYAKQDLNLPTMQGVMVGLKDAIEKQEKKEEKLGNKLESIFEGGEKLVEKSEKEDLENNMSMGQSMGRAMDHEGYEVEQPPSQVTQVTQSAPKIRSSQAAIEDDILRMAKTKIVPVIKNHLKKEPLENIHEALRSYQGAVEILSKFEKPFLLQNLSWLMETALRMGVLEWYEELYNKTVPPRNSERIHYVSCVAKVLKEVNTLIKERGAKLGHEFWLIAALKYLPIVYDELQKLVVHDVEATCWFFFEFYTDHRKLRNILLSNDESDSLFRNAFFDLYTQTDKFVAAQKDIFGEDKEPFCLLKTFHRWFRPTVTLWLGYAIIRGSTIIRKTINIDDNVQDNPNAMTSSSALDTSAVFCQLVQFWGVLNWPDISESYVIINFLMDVMCSYTILYAGLKHAKLEKEGYYDPDGRFDISERLCTAINNIEHVKEQALSIPNDINLSDLTERLEEACGKTTQVINYEKKAKLRFERTTQIVNKHIDDILDNVGRRIQKDMSSYIEQTFNSILELDDHKLEDAIEPIVAYLDENINMLNQALLPRNFHKVLQFLWNLVCRSLQADAGKFELEALEDQYIFFTRLIKVIPSLQDYVQGGEAGIGLSNADADTKDCREMYNLFKYFTRSTEELIGLYYYSRAQTHLNYSGTSCLGTLRVRLSYWNGKLTVEVVSAIDLTPHDEPLTIFKYFHKSKPTSDPFVEVELKPHTLFSNEKMQVTEVKFANLNPIFEQSFNWKVRLDDCLKPSAVILLTVKDYDLLSKNDFLGEAIIPMHVIPGISSQPEPQPMNLALHEVDKANQVLTVLHTRKWDSKAKQFYDSETSRYVEPVIMRKGKECEKYADRY